MKKAPRYLFSSSEVGPEHMIGIGDYGTKAVRRVSKSFFIFYFRRQLGGLIPRSIDVYNPGLSTKVTIDIPEGNGSTIPYRIFTRDSLIHICLESLRKVPDYKFLLAKALESGKSPQLAWRYQTNLDWVWLDHDVFGMPREWSVLCGLAFKEVRVFIIPLIFIDDL